MIDGGTFNPLSTGNANVPIAGFPEAFILSFAPSAEEREPRIFSGALFAILNTPNPWEDSKLTALRSVFLHAVASMAEAW